MKRFIVGDIHGAYRALIQVLERAGFNEKEDTLYSVGDYVDGWSESSKVIQYLMSLQKFKGVIGNHDSWAANWLTGGPSEYIWVSQGGAATRDSYNRFSEEEKRNHGIFIKLLPVFIKEKDIFICHGGVINLEYLKKIESYWLSAEEIMWDRDMYLEAAIAKDDNIDISIEPFKKVFIGHTQTSREIPDFTPFQYKGLWNVDQGAGWNGKLTVVNIDTDEWWQSDFVVDLYPKEKRRR